MMDVSPYPAPAIQRTPLSATSHNSTPSSHKRLREEDIKALLAEPPLRQQQETWSPPKRSSVNASAGGRDGIGGASGSGDPSTSSAMCVTPIAGFTNSSATAAIELGVRWAVHQRQGPRSTQEDVAVAKVNEGAFIHAYFGVFDGHGGAQASTYAASMLHSHVMRSEYMPTIVQALQDGFMRTDAELLHHFSMRRGKGNNQGTAAAVTLVTDDKLVTAWAGDCRALLVKRSSSPVPYIELSRDHSAEQVSAFCHPRPDEVERVESAGARMDPGGYVCIHDHSLPMTRALGDLPLKVGPGRSWRDTPAHAQVVTGRPEVSVYERSADDLCVILASDGLFGSVMTSAEVASVVREQLEQVHAHALDAEIRTARCLCDRALCERNGSDNVSVVVISLEPPITASHLPAPSSGGGSVAHVLSSLLPKLATSASTSSDGSSVATAPIVGGNAVGMGGEPPAHHLLLPMSLAWMDKASTPSLDSLASEFTADTASARDLTSPMVGCLPFEHKLLMRFGDAYPAADGAVLGSPYDSAPVGPSLWSPQAMGDHYDAHSHQFESRHAPHQSRRSALNGRAH